MALEIEHKYLLISEDYKKMATADYAIKQGYLSREPQRVVRVRTKGIHGYITVKGITQYDVREEFEYEIPLADAEAMLHMCVPPIIEKRRYIVPFEGFKWEVDEFTSPTDMTVAEIELPTPDTPYKLPPFIGREVTGDPAYYNSNLK